ncbi:hypothetical protein KVR01_004715 [Diaporthe batatas]|uniref:uncharacterized protein n=1 Tax=Diaporthe batatas TaxID=748121 RepID=UPI001D046F5E|nr:uncharacterized protein KVR01_004715 [Diaporthe batatas]KAG8166163.1 hypothetical protein KVR01_004715 [Diaporthe batatas]
MAIRDTWHRMVRKSFSSSSSTARSDDGDDTAPPAAAPPAGTSPTPSVPLSKTSSRLTGNLSKMTSWRSHASHNRHGGSSGAKDHGGSGSGDSGGGASRKASPKRDSPPKSILKRSGGNGGGGGGGGGPFGSAFPKRVHPSERPLTEQNLRHQEMLGTFTMKFGRSRRFSRGGRSSFSGISPRCSIDSSAGTGAGVGGWGADDDDDLVGGGGMHHRRMSSAAVAPDEARIAEESS